MVLYSLNSFREMALRVLRLGSNFVGDKTALGLETKREARRARKRNEVLIKQ